MSLRCFGHAGTQFRVTEEKFDGTDQGIVAMSIHRKSRNAVLDQLRRSSVLSNDHRAAGGHGISNDNSKPFEIATSRGLDLRMQKNVCLLVQRDCIGIADIANQLNVLIEAKLGDEGS